MTISVGDKLPEATFRVMQGDDPAEMTVSEVFGNKKVVLFAVPGAFTPTCHQKHLPGFQDKLAEFKSRGVDTVACTAVNDVFVMDAWSQATRENDILFLADGNGEFARATGLELDLTAGGLGQRSKRYAMLVEDGVVKALNIENAPGIAEVSSAEELLKAL